MTFLKGGPSGGMENGGAGKRGEKENCGRQDVIYERINKLKKLVLKNIESFFIILFFKYFHSLYILIAVHPPDTPAHTVPPLLL